MPKRRISRKQKRNSRKTKRQLKKQIMQQSGGAGAPGSDQSYTPQDVEEFFIELTRIMENIAKLSGDSRPVGPDYTGKFFYNKIRPAVHLRTQWLKMFNECFNQRGQTPLYVILRFGPTMLCLNVLRPYTYEKEEYPEGSLDVNRKNADGSTPLIGLFFGKNGYDPISFTKASLCLNLLIQLGGDLNIPNNAGETGLMWLKHKHKNSLITYLPKQKAEYDEWISRYI